MTGDNLVTITRSTKRTRRYNHSYIRRAGDPDS